jgi:anti-sigma regulatory factor (Ser/Thr protein kinase)
MIELIIDAVKLVFSEEARKSASGLIEFIRRSPDWQKDICTLEAKVDVDSREHAYLLGGLTASKMENLGHSPESVQAFEHVHRELSSNAFEHGCRPDSKDRITILIEITPHFVSITVRNPRGSRFDFAALLETQEARIRQNVRSTRGRGLAFVNEFADSVTATPDRDGVKALFYKPSVQLGLNRLDQLAVIQVVDGLENPSIRRRVQSLAQQCDDCVLVLDLAKFTAKGELRLPSTAMIGGSIELRNVFESKGKRVVMLLPHNPSSRVFSSGIIDPSMLAFSVEEAARKLGKPELKSKLERLIRQR